MKPKPLIETLPFESSVLYNKHITVAARGFTLQLSSIEGEDCEQDFIIRTPDRELNLDMDDFTAAYNEVLRIRGLPRPRLNPDGLSWHHTDDEACTVSIRNGGKHVPGCRHILPPKTTKSNDEGK